MYQRMMNIIINIANPRKRMAYVLNTLCQSDYNKSYLNRHGWVYVK